MGERASARRHGILFCLQQSRCAAVVGACAKHITTDGDGHADRLGAGATAGIWSATTLDVCRIVQSPGPQRFSWSFRISSSRSECSFWRYEADGFPREGWSRRLWRASRRFRNSGTWRGTWELPILALVLSVLPSLVRHVRAAVAEVLDAPSCGRRQVTVFPAQDYFTGMRYVLPRIPSSRFLDLALDHY